MSNRTTNVSRAGRLLGSAALSAVALMLAGGGQARADTAWIEAESTRADSFRGSVTSPLRIRDSGAASNGGFVEVQSGNNSTGSMPALGRVCHTFGISTPGSYRIWGRVQAATTSDDSFWVKMDGGAPINWRLALGSAWHWDLVRPSGSSTPSVFNLTAGDHTLCTAYREDGAKLDLLVITSDAGFDPGQPPAGAPASPAGAQALGGPARILVTWTLAPGAQQYVVSRRTGFGDGSGNLPPFVPIATVGATTFELLDQTAAAGEVSCYQITARNAAGDSAPLEQFPCEDPEFDAIVAEAETYGLTAPLRVVEDVDGHAVVEVTPGNNSTAAPPATGWARFDFRLAGARTVKLWGAVVAPSNGDDSFWVRMDFGPWIKWNDWQVDPTETCQWDDIHNSDGNGQAIHYSLAAGTHTLELAYREDRAQLDKVYITDNLGTTPPGGCFD